MDTSSLIWVDCASAMVSNGYTLAFLAAKRGDECHSEHGIEQPFSPLSVSLSSADGIRQLKIHSDLNNYCDKCMNTLIASLGSCGDKRSLQNATMSLALSEVSDAMGFRRKDDSAVFAGLR
jgi:hypothetical protein